jgi:hypothetical protein
LGLEFFQAQRGTENCGNVPCTGQGGLGLVGGDSSKELRLMGFWVERRKRPPRQVL